MSAQSTADDTRRLTVQIVSAHIGHNKVAQGDLPALIEQVYGALSGLGKAAEATAPARPEPAVSIRKSVTPDYLVCLEDGKKLKMLKRHLSSAYNMTPDQYRERWGLPADYPMVSPNYAQQRSTMAKKIGLGTRRVEPVPAPAPAAPAKVPRTRKPAAAKAATA
ncbi:MucR family transcriptional regulator [Inquilinus ginsengisoli]|uniref:MucR family transcriptional regulator n=1 Tax=Inquilinus ginsengisoli TaxID=363840 RepID=UPI003D2447C1